MKNGTVSLFVKMFCYPHVQVWATLVPTMGVGVNRGGLGTGLPLACFAESSAFLLGTGVVHTDDTYCSILHMTLTYLPCHATECASPNIS